MVRMPESTTLFRCSTLGRLLGPAEMLDPGPNSTRVWQAGTLEIPFIWNIAKMVYPVERSNIMQKWSIRWKDPI